MFTPFKTAFGFLDPITSRLQPRRLWGGQRVTLKRLWTAPTPQARFIILSGAWWTIPGAVTEPYRMLYYSRLGLSDAALGALMGLDMGLRAVFLLAAAWVAERLGPKRTLIAFDLVSWVGPSIVLATAQHPWQLVLAAGLYATNCVSSVAYQLLVVHKLSPGRVARTYAFQNMFNLLPNLLLPGLAAWLVGRYEFKHAMHALFAAQAVMMALGVATRWPLMWDVPSGKPEGAAEPLAAQARRVWGAFRELLGRREFRRVLALFVAANVANAVSASFFALFAVRELGLGDAAPGLAAQAVAAGMVLANWQFIPALKAWQLRAALLFAGLAYLLVPALWLARPGLAGTVALSGLQGFAWAVFLSLMAAELAAALPERNKAWGFALALATSQLAQGLALPLLGLLFGGGAGRFALAMLALAALQACLAWRLWALDKPSAQRG